MLDAKLAERKKKLSNLIKAIGDDSNSDFNLKVRVSSNNGKTRYFVCREGDAHYSYAGKDSLPLIRKSVQKDYEKRVFEAANEELKAVEKLLKVRSENTVENVYSKAADGRKSLLCPVAVSDDDYALQWQNVNFENYKGNSKCTGKKTGFITKKGENVRSVSEKIIADRLYDLKIPYRYLCPLVCRDTVIYPLFSILKKHGREVFVFEHFAFMEDEAYRQNVYRKLSFYSSLGYVFGKNLLLTFSEGNRILDIDLLDRILNEVFLDSSLDTRAGI